jgi:chemotaxis protein methyltransferase CheR
MGNLNHPDISDAEFAQFQRLIYQIAGISLADSKKVLLVGRLGKRLKALGLPSFGAYYKHVASGNDPGERQTMVDLLTTNETYFFREEAHFDFLRQTVLPQHPPGESFDVWSAASSTGEEIYTISMVLGDELGVT